MNEKGYKEKMPQGETLVKDDMKLLEIKFHDKDWKSILEKKIKRIRTIKND